VKKVDAIEKKNEDDDIKEKTDNSDAIEKEIETPDYVVKIVPKIFKNESSIEASKQVLQAFDQQPQVQLLYFPF
jgi:hypothetical protein